LKGSDTWSLNTSGAAPVPPSPPSMVMKSTPRSPRAISRARSCQSCISPTADLIPTGRPETSASFSTKSSSSSAEEKAECAFGLMQVTPTGIRRIRAISGVTLAPGSTPPRPGLAPWLSLISIARTFAEATSSRKRSMLKRPRSSRQPK
jgi:hypothetical protein